MRTTPHPLEERMTLFWHDHVDGVDALPPGRYEFTCSLHPAMLGVLLVG